MYVGFLVYHFISLKFIVAELSVVMLARSEEGNSMSIKSLATKNLRL
jgi:hypothetical protein